jgi:hypothetical protein
MISTRTCNRNRHLRGLVHYSVSHSVGTSDSIQGEARATHTRVRVPPTVTYIDRGGSATAVALTTVTG